MALGIAADATTAMAAFAFATWTTTLVQLVLFNRCLARTGAGRAAALRCQRLDQDRRARSSRSGRFYMLLTYTDVLVLRQFRPPEEVAHYYAAAKTLALVTFIHFSVSAAVSHRFAAHHVAGDGDGACGARRQHRALDVLAVAAGDRADPGASANRSCGCSARVSTPAIR